MPRIPDAEVDRIKCEVSLEQLAQARGIQLERHGKDLRGLCPFHEDHSPSLVIEPEANLWHCFGACNAGGSVVDWVMRAEGVSFRHALELLRAGLPTLLEPAARSAPIKRTTVRRLPPAVQLGADHFKALDQVVAYYHKKLPENPQALAYLSRRGLASSEMLAHFRVGFCDRTLGLTIPENNRDTGAAIRDQLKTLGILNPDTGHELFRGCLTIPLFDFNGQVVSLYGRRLSPPRRHGEKRSGIDHLYLPGGHRGLLNLAAFQAADELILCESPLDALTFWCAGYRNVTSSFGTNGFTDTHREALRRFATRRVLIAYDNDEAGNSAAEKLSAELMAAGLDCFRIRLPHGLDVNEYALKVKPAAKILGIAIRKADWLGNGHAPAQQPGAALPRTPEDASAHGQDEPTEDPPPVPAALAAQLAGELPGQLSLFAASSPEQTPHDASAAKEEAAPPVPAHDSTSEDPTTPMTPSTTREPPAASPLPAPPAPPEIRVTASADEITLQLADRRYRARGLAKNTSFDALRVNLLVNSDAGFHVDTLDLLQAKQRSAFEKAAALELGCPDALIHSDLRLVLLKLEELQYDALKKTLEPAPAAPQMTEAEREAALELLRDPRLAQRILDDYSATGCVGENTNKLIGHIGAISRKLQNPLAIIIQSSSAAGKSTLMDSVLDFVPPEEREKFSAMTGQALFYMGQTNLSHKVLAIVEEEGAERASYALKLLQSEGQLTIASTGKDPTTGKLVTHRYEVDGPVMIFLTTTALEIDDELQNRCLVLSVDEERAQTRAIHSRQRLRHTVAGLAARLHREDLLKLHQNAQRLLQPLAVDNPFAARLTFRDDRTRTRRDHEKYLTLIDAIALLHQFQRPHLTLSHRGKSLTYIRATRSDVALANRLADEVLGRSLDELPPQTRRLLAHLDAMASQECALLGCSRTAYRFTRRQLREFSGWNQTQLRLHLVRLEELEYLITHRSGHGLSVVYELAYDGRGADGRRFLPGLIDVDALPEDSAPAAHEYESDLSGVNADLSGQTSHLSPPDRPDIGPLSPPYRPDQNAETLHPASVLTASDPISPQNAHQGISPRAPASYPQPRRTRTPAGGNGSARPAPAAASLETAAQRRAG
jgi:DNA primase catalytic core